VPSANGHQTMTILMAEDDPDDRILTREAMESAHVANDLRFVNDGQYLMDYLRREGDYADSDAEAPMPGIILLDLNMPRMDGREALAEIKADPELRKIPVVVLTTSKAEEDIGRSYQHHANCYITKPVDIEKFRQVVSAIESFWFTVVELPRDDHPAPAR